MSRSRAGGVAMLKADRLSAWSGPRALVKKGGQLIELFFVREFPGAEVCLCPFEEGHEVQQSSTSGSEIRSQNSFAGPKR